MIDTQTLYDVRQHDIGPWGGELFFLALALNLVWVSRTGALHPGSWCGRVLQRARNGSAASAWVWRHPNVMAGFFLLFVVPLPFGVISWISDAADIHRGNYESYAGTLDGNVLVRIQGRRGKTEEDRFAVGPLRFHLRCGMPSQDGRRPGARGACIAGVQLGDRLDVDYKSQASSDDVRVLRIWRDRPSL